MPTFVYMTACDGCGHCVDIAHLTLCTLTRQHGAQLTLNQIFAGNVIHVLKLVHRTPLMTVDTQILRQWGTK